MSFVNMPNGSISDTDHFHRARNELESWYFIQHTWPIVSILIAYSAFIYIDLKFLKKRKPIDPKFFMILFNVYQVVTNVYHVYLGLLPDSVHYILNHGCHPMDPANNYLWERGFYGGKLFMISKLADLLDTVFIVLRKKRSQVTVLHIYHHFSMVPFTWFCLKYFYGEQLVIIMIVNSFVHVVMYSYYGLSLIGPSIRKYLWWKKYVTILQLSQFVLYMVHTIGLIIFGCQHSTPLCLFVCWQAFIFYALFANFYNKQYREKTITQNTASNEKTKVM